MFVELPLLVWLAVGICIVGTASVVFSQAAEWLLPVPSDPMLIHDPPRMPIPPTPNPTPIADGMNAVFEWEYTDRTGTRFPMRVQFPISLARVTELRHEPRLPALQDYVEYAARNVPELDSLAKELLTRHLENKLSSYDAAANVLTFVQSCIQYAHDIVTKQQLEYPRYALETLADRVGDCEDMAILAAAALSRIGFEAALIWVPDAGLSEDGRPVSHMALGLLCSPEMPGKYVIDPQTGLRYYYAETTGLGWSFGEMPAKYRGQALDVYPVRIVPDVPNS